MDDTGSIINELNEEEIIKQWELVAKSLLQVEKSGKPKRYPEPTGVFVTWRGSAYIGSIQVIVPDFSKEIVVLSMTSSPPPVKLVDAMKRICPGRLELTADDMLDMIGRQHVLRRMENRLTLMTPDQTAYMLLHPPVIHEI